MRADDGRRRHYSLYVLKLTDGKYYVGLTSKTPQETFWEHQHDIRAASWTQKYKPTQLFDSKNLGVITYAEAEKYESKVTRLYMKKYGLNNVRGGDLTGIDDYIVRFGRVFNLSGWQMIVGIVFLLLVIVILTVQRIR